MKPITLLIALCILYSIGQAQTKKPDTIKVATSDVEALQRMIPQPCWYTYKSGKSNLAKVAAGFVRDNRNLNMKLLPVPTRWIVLVISPRKEDGKP